MLPRVSDRLLLACFLALAVSSVALKAAAGPARDGFNGPQLAQIVTRFQSTLQAQGFVAQIDPTDSSSSSIIASRGPCRLVVRDARGAELLERLFARDARKIGPMRFFYDGRAYHSVPSVLIRLERIKADLLARLGVNRSAPLPVALAKSSGCGSSDFGLDRLRIST